MPQGNYIHNRRINKDNTYYYRETAAHPTIPVVPQSKQAKLSEAERMETELFFRIEQYKKAVEKGDADLAYELHTKIEELKLPYARYCA